jgi:hypothetical protein
MPCPWLQVLASGSCIDGSVCAAGLLSTTCKSATSGGRHLKEDIAVANMYYSTAYKLFQPGTYTVLVRGNSYQACGTGANKLACYESTNIAYALNTGRLEGWAQQNTWPAASLFSWLAGGIT